MKSSKSYVGLGQVPVGIGAVLRGWDITEHEFKDGTCVVDFRAMTEKCPHNCFHCFTNKNRRTLSLQEIEQVINEIALSGARAINFLGEGEPTIDPNFFEIVEYTYLRNLIPVVFTDAATKLRDKDFVRRLYYTGASVLPKCDSIFSAQYQNWVVGDNLERYFHRRNEALEMLIEEGFNKVRCDGATRLGLDMVISKRNVEEVAETLRYCRRNNIWIVFAFYLPSGRSANADFDHELELNIEERQAMRVLIQSIDRDEFSFDHDIWSNFATQPCIERLQIYGDGRVSPCPGNETIIGNVKEHSIQALTQMILRDFPCHNPSCFDGNCLYRPKV